MIFNDFIHFLYFLYFLYLYFIAFCQEAFDWQFVGLRLREEQVRAGARDEGAPEADVCHFQAPEELGVHEVPAEA